MTDKQFHILVHSTFEEHKIPDVFHKWLKDVAEKCQESVIEYSLESVLKQLEDLCSDFNKCMSKYPSNMKVQS